jgi:Tfp pilus assembly protein PilV
MQSVQRERTGDRGNSLVEVLMAVVLTSVAIIPLMGASWALVRNSAQNRSSTQVETVINNAADRVNRAIPGCDYLIYVQAAAMAEGWQPTQASATYQYFVPNANATLPGTWVAGGCPNGVRPAGLVQMVRITVTSADGRVTRTIQVVKSDV